MRPLIHARRWKLASIALLSAVLVAALMPAVWFWDDRVSGLRWVEGIDKWTHAATFVVLALWFCGMYSRSVYWIIAGGLLIFGIAIEGCQYLVSYRTADWVDVAADAVGIAVGLAVARAGVEGWCQRFESRFWRRGAGQPVD